MGFQVRPSSSDRNAPAAEMADVDPAGVVRVEEDRVQAHPARARLPLGPGAVAAQPGELVPAPASVVGAEERRILDTRVHRVRVGEGRLEMPHALELPGPLGAVIVLVGRQRPAGLGRDVIGELVALALGRSIRHGRRLARRCAGLVPRGSAVVGALDDLPEPSAGLRRVDAVGVGRRPLDVVDLPAREVRTVDLPAPPQAVRGENECTLARTDQDPDSAHAGASFGRPPDPRRTLVIPLRVRRPQGSLVPFIP